MLNKWYLKNDTPDVIAQKVWQDMCHYLYLPRLANDDVLRNAISTGVESDDYFGYASAKEGDQYLGFTFGRRGFTAVDSSSVFIERDAAFTYRLKITPPPKPEPEPGPGPGPNPDPGPDPKPDPDPLPKALKTQFYGSVKLNAVRAKLDFATIMDEVVQQFTQRGLEVSISVDIHVSNPAGFDDAVQRSVRENCNVLKIDPAEFEE